MPLRLQTTAAGPEKALTWRWVPSRLTDKRDFRSVFILQETTGKQESFCILSRRWATRSENGANSWHWTKENVTESRTASGTGIWTCHFVQVESLGGQEELLYALLVSHLATWFKMKFFGSKLTFAPWLTQEPGQVGRLPSTTHHCCYANNDTSFICVAICTHLVSSKN